jgi:D-alanyl-D-alanine carboxypeptidase
MNLGKIIFFGITLFVLFGLVNKMQEPNNYPESFDNRIKLTSLVSSSRVLERPPIIIPLPAEPFSEKLVKPEPSISARAALVIRFADNARLLSFNEAGRHPLASLTKLMTAIVATEKMGAARGVTISEEDVWQEGGWGELAVGEVWSVADLIKAMLVVSSNDAAHALARVYDYRDFINAMQDKARELGMTNTSFADATGISSLNQGTAEDIGKLIAYVREKHPSFFTVSSLKEVDIKEVTSGKSRQLKNINKFAGRTDFLGGKTGYTEEAGGNLVSIFSHNGTALVIIILGAAEIESRFTETERLYEWTKIMLQ